MNGLPLFDFICSHNPPSRRNRHPFCWVVAFDMTDYYWMTQTEHMIMSCFMDHLGFGLGRLRLTSEATWLSQALLLSSQRWLECTRWPWAAEHERTVMIKLKLICYVAKGSKRHPPVRQPKTSIAQTQKEVRLDAAKPTCEGNNAGVMTTQWKCMTQWPPCGNWCDHMKSQDEQEHLYKMQKTTCESIP